MRIAVTGIGLIENKGESIDLSGLSKQVRTVLRMEELALYAAKLALKDAGLSIKEDPISIGIVLGVDEGIDDCKAKFFYDPCPLIFPFTSPNAITAQVSIAFGIRGECITIANGCLSSGKAIAYSMDLLRLGKVKGVVTGGVTSDCAIIAVLENLETATKRGAKVCREIIGYEDSTWGDHLQAITQAIKETGLHPPKVDWCFINNYTEGIIEGYPPVKGFDSHGAVSSIKAVVKSLTTVDGKVMVITTIGSSGSSLSLVIA